MSPEIRAIKSLILVTILTLVSLWIDIGISLWNRAQIAHHAAERLRIEQELDNQYGRIEAELGRLAR